VVKVLPFQFRRLPILAMLAISFASLCLHLSATDPTRLLRFCCKQKRNRIPPRGDRAVKAFLRPFSSREISAKLFRLAYIIGSSVKFVSHHAHLAFGIRIFKLPTRQFLWPSADISQPDPHPPIFAPVLQTKGLFHSTRQAQAYDKAVISQSQDCRSRFSSVFRLANCNC
jgi:hypothetical protein